MFESVVTKLVKAIGSDSYLPSSSVLSSEELSPLSLVERKASRWYFGRNSYYPTEFKLTDVLQKTDSSFKTDLEPEKDVCGFAKNAVVKINGELAAHFKALFEAELDNVDSVTVKADLGDLHQAEVDLQSLLNNIKSRRLDMNHELIRELSKKDRRALCVVVGTIKTTKDTQIIASLNFKTDANAKVNIPAVSVDVEAKGEVEDDKSRTLSLPAGTVLAYQVLELSVDKKGLFRVMVSHNAKGGFNCAAIDEVDAQPTSDMIVGEQNLGALYYGFTLMTDENQRCLLRKVQILCGDKTLIDQLALSLRVNTSSHKNSGIQEVLCLVNEHADSQQVSSALLSLTRALRNLDPQLLYDMSLLSSDEVQLMSSILSSCQKTSVLPRSSAPVSELFSRGDKCLRLLLDDLMFNLTDNGLSFSKNNSILVNSAYMAFHALNMMN